MSDSITDLLLALIGIFVVCFIGFLVCYMVFDTITQDKIGTNGVIYQKVFHDCVVEVKSVSRNTSTVEDDDLISECRFAALQAARCVYNGKECI